VAADPQRVHRATAAIGTITAAEARALRAQEAGLWDVTGYRSKVIMQDPRFRVGEALRSAGLVRVRRCLRMPACLSGRNGNSARPFSTC
jgi:hypothetical protein